jgi:O-antigen/teichoic acid export membrane protein
MLRSGGAGLGVTAFALIGSGLLVNLLLAIVARNVSASEYALFSAFWSIALVAGFGVFLPIEQWLAARPASFAQAAAEAASVVPLALRLAAVEAVVMAVAAWALFRAMGGQTSIVVALVALCLVSAAQFLARGALIAAQRMDVYAAVLVVDVCIRIALAMVFAAYGSRSAAPYAWAVVVGIALAHLPVLCVIYLRRGPRRPRGVSPTRPILLLLVGALGAQALFNGPAVVLTAVAPRGDLAEVGAFQAAFQLVRIPLFLAIPMQATLVPVMVRVLRGLDERTGRRLIGQYAVGVVGSIPLGAAVGWWLGPWLVHAVFGDKYDVSSQLVALLAVGAVAYLALLVLTQVFVADGLHELVGTSWGLGLVVASAWLVVAHAQARDAGAAFVAGSAVALAWALRALSRSSRAQVGT